MNQRPENLRGLCHDVVECLRVLAEDKGQTLTFNAVSDLRATVDRDTLWLVLMNLIANAIRFTPERGEISVHLGHHAAGAIAIEVRDTGPGIAKEHHARLFERFYRVDPSRSHATGDTGLGLAIARCATEANGGQIELDSGLGRVAASASS